MIFQTKTASTCTAAQVTGSNMAQRITVFYNIELGLSTKQGHIAIDIAAKAAAI